MNKTVTSKEEIIKKAQELVDRVGMERLNIRMLAIECHISVGTIYNYFEDKDALDLAVVQHYWQDKLQFSFYEHTETSDFMQLAKDLYQIASNAESKMFLKKHRILIGKNGKLAAKQVMWEHIRKICDMFEQTLERDPRVRKDVWDEIFTPHRFSSFVLEHIINVLTEERKDCNFLFVIIEKLIY